MSRPQPFAVEEDPRPPIRVNLPGGKVVHYPAGTPTHQIQAHLDSLYPAPEMKRANKVGGPAPAPAQQMRRANTVGAPERLIPSAPPGMEPIPPSTVTGGGMGTMLDFNQNKDNTIMGQLGGLGDIGRSLVQQLMGGTEGSYSTIDTENFLPGQKPRPGTPRYITAERFGAIAPPFGKAIGAAAGAAEEVAAPVGKALRSELRATRALRSMEQEAPLAQYANEYPKLPRPVRKFDTDKAAAAAAKGKEYKGYLAKGTNPENEKFYADRLKIDKAVKKGGYKPYFDPEKRFHVDPANYPEGPSVYTEGMPKTQEKIDDWREKIQTPEARQRLQEAFDHGLKTGGHDRWYMMGQLEKEFIDEYGEKQGRSKFKEWADAMASTTGGQDPENNLLMAHYGRMLKQRGVKIPTAAYKLNSPIRGGFAAGNMKLLEKYVAQGESIGSEAPKRLSFTSDFQGKTDYPTIDKQMSNLISGKDAPEGDSYFAYAELVRDMAKANNIPIDEFQAIVWGGKKAMATKGKYVGKSMIQIVNEAIERTARMTGRSPREIVRKGLVRAEIPLYGVLGAAGLGAAASPGAPPPSRPPD